METREDSIVLVILSIVIVVFILLSLYILPRNCVYYTEVPSITTKLISMESNSYQISIKYPFFAVKKLDRVIDGVIHSEVARFKKLMPAGPVSHGWIYSLWMDYKSWKFTRNIVSVKFEDYIFSGGAHGNTLIVTKVINAKTGEEYSLSDIFKSDTDFPKILSDLIIPSLTRKLGRMSDEKWIASGAGPKEVNFKKFVLTPKELIIYFEQYSVAPYAAGIQEERIPLAKIKIYLNPLFNK